MPRRATTSRSTARCALTSRLRQNAAAPLFAEDCPLGGTRVGRCDFGAVVETHPRHLDKAALGQDSHPLVADRDNLADLVSAHHAKSLGRDLARVEQIEFPLAEGRPGAGCGVAAADQVVDEIDMV